MNLKQLVAGKTDNTYIQAFRYLVSGGTAFVVDAGVLFLLTQLPLFLDHYLWAASIAFLAGLTVAYLLSIVWVFSSRTFKSPLLEFALFAVIGLLGLGLNNLLIWLGTEHVFPSLIADKQLRVLASKFASQVFVLAWNFGIRKILLFK